MTTHAKPATTNHCRLCKGEGKVPCNLRSGPTVRKCRRCHGTGTEPAS